MLFLDLFLSTMIINSSLRRQSDDNLVILLVGRFTLFCMLNIMRLLRLKKLNYINLAITDGPIY